MKRGFTLVETILYAGLLVLLLGAVINSVVFLSTSYRSLKDIRNVQTSALTAMSRMVKEIRAAETIDGSGTSYNSPGGALLLDTGVRFYLSNGQVLMSKNGQYFGPLTRDDVSVGGLTFRHIDTGNSEGVKIEITIENKNFYHTVMLRGSY